MANLSRNSFVDGTNKSRSGLTSSYKTWDEATETWNEATQTWDEATGLAFTEGVNKTRNTKP